jgi:hypothetical protein
MNYLCVENKFCCCEMHIDNKFQVGLMFKISWCRGREGQNLVAVAAANEGNTYLD